MAEAPRFDRELRRLLAWWSARWLIRLTATALAAVLLAQVALAWRGGDRQPITATAPERSAIDRALAAADAYLDGLYRRLPHGASVVSEYYGLPLVVTIGGSTVVRPGDPGLAIESVEQTLDRESYRLTYTLPDLPRVVLTASVRWRADGGGELTVAESRGDVPVPVTVSLEDRTLASWDDPVEVRARTVRLGPEDLTVLKSLRYTVRHVAIMSADYYRYRAATGAPGAPATRRWADRAERLQRVVDAAGYDSHRDVYSSLWGTAGGQPPDFVQQPAVYRDCDPDVVAALPQAVDYYPYASKACSVTAPGYVALSRTDPLVRLSQSLHVVQEAAWPEARFDDGEHFGLTPAGVAADLESRYDHAVGIGTCLPGLCTDDASSTLRTALFGALQTELGYRHADPVSRTYADSVATEILATQVGPDATIGLVGGRQVRRPVQAGGFLTAYDATLAAGEPDSFSRRQMSAVAGALNVRSEYVGDVVTNAETTLVVYAFLLRYRCARFPDTCAQVPQGAAPPPAPPATTRLADARD